MTATLTNSGDTSGSIIATYQNCYSLITWSPDTATSEVTSMVKLPAPSLNDVILETDNTV